MAIQRIVNSILYGLHADTKPTTSATNTLFYETDTTDIYIYNGTTWVLYKSATKTETLSNKTIDGGSNTLTNIAAGSLPATIPYTGQTNTWGAFNQIYPSSRLLIQNPAATFNYTVVASAITAARNLTIPLLTGNDQITTDAFATTLTNKTMSGASNTFTNVPDSALSANVDLLNGAQTITGAKTFTDTDLLLRNPANTFSVTLGGGAQTAARTFTLPVTTSDTIDTIAATATLTNKTMVAASNTITDTSTAAGDILKSNGTKFVRLARGSTNQVLQSGASDVSWVSLTVVNTGTATGAANGSTTVFTIAHSIGSTPSMAQVIPSSVIGSTVNYSFAYDSTNITVTFASAPSTGTITFQWLAVA